MVFGGSNLEPGWHVADLARAAREAGVELCFASFEELTARVGSGAFGESSAGSSAGDLDLGELDALIVRTMPRGSLEQIIFRMDVLHQLEARGIAIINRPRALETAIDKYLALARLDAAGLPLPPTRIAQNSAATARWFVELGRDVVFKPLFGSEGRGQVRVTDEGEAERVAREIESTGAVVYLQRFIDHGGSDLRIFVCDGAVIGAMRRSTRDSWRTNVACGGNAEPASISRELAELALAAARSVGTEIAGVDIIEDEDGHPWILEVNGVPGWRALAAVCKLDVAREIVRYALARGRGSRAGRSSPRDRGPLDSVELRPAPAEERASR